MMLAVASIVFFVVARIDAEAWSSNGFIGFSLAYVTLAPLSKSERIATMLRYSKHQILRFLNPYLHD